MSPIFSVSPSPTARQSKTFPKSLTEGQQVLLEPFGREHGQVLASDAVAQEHVEAVDVDAVVGMAVREHDRGEVLTPTCSCRWPNVPLPQSIQIDVSPDRSR